MRLGLDNGAAAQYPVERFLSNNTRVMIRPVVKDDEEALLAYYRSLPDIVRLRLRQDNTNRAILKRFLEEIPLGRMISLAAFTHPDDGEPELVGEATLRIMHHAAWIARRWQDPAFPTAFPWFESPRFWSDHLLELREQQALLDEPPLTYL